MSCNGALTCSEADLCFITADRIPEESFPCCFGVGTRSAFPAVPSMDTTPVAIQPSALL